MTGWVTRISAKASNPVYTLIRARRELGSTGQRPRRAEDPSICKKASESIYIATFFKTTNQKTSFQTIMYTQNSNCQTLPCERNLYSKQDLLSEYFETIWNSMQVISKLGEITNFYDSTRWLHLRSYNFKRKNVNGSWFSCQKMGKIMHKLWKIAFLHVSVLVS